MNSSALALRPNASVGQGGASSKIEQQHPSTKNHELKVNTHSCWRSVVPVTGPPATMEDMVVLSVHSMLLAMGLSPLNEAQGRGVLMPMHGQYRVKYVSSAVEGLQIEMTAAQSVCLDA